MPLLLLLFSHSVMFDRSWPHGLQHTRLPCPLLYPWVYWNSCSLSQWCHQTISSSVAPFSSCSQSFPGSGSFPMNWVCLSSGQSIGASPSASILQMNIQDWFPLELADLISLLSKWLSRVLSTPQFKNINSSLLSLLYSPALTSKRNYGKKNQSFDYTDICHQVMFLFFNMLSRFVIDFLTRSKYLSISWLQSLSAVILEPPKRKSVTISFLPHLYAM